MQTPNEKLLNQINRLTAKHKAVQEKLRLARIKSIKQAKTLERKQRVKWEQDVKKSLAQFYPLPVELIEKAVAQAATEANANNSAPSQNQSTND